MSGKHAGLSWHEFSIPQDFIEDECLSCHFGPLISARLLVSQIGLQKKVEYFAFTKQYNERENIPSLLQANSCCIV